MRAIRFIPFVAIALSTIACTSLLGSFETGAGGGTGSNEGGGGGGGEASVPGDSATDTSTVMADAHKDAPPTCTAPSVACGDACVVLDTDGKNCGACGRSCFGGTCTARVCGEAVFAARTGLQPGTLVATDTDLFFASLTFEVTQLPLSGGAPITLAIAPGTVFAIAPTATRVFFTTGSAGTWDVWRATVGMANSGVARGQTLGGTPVGLIAAGANLFTTQVLVGGAEMFQLVTCPQAGGACFANFNGPGRPGLRLSAGNGFVFWVDQFGFIYATPDAVGQRTTIASGEATPDSPSWDGASLFWSNNGSGRLRRSPFPNPTAGEVRDIGSSSNDMVVDATNIYYAQNIGPGMDELFVIAKNAGAATLPVKVAAGDIRRLTQNATALFWYDPATGIHVLRKP